MQQLLGDVATTVGVFERQIELVRCPQEITAAVGSVARTALRSARPVEVDVDETAQFARVLHPVVARGAVADEPRDQLRLAARVIYDFRSGGTVRRRPRRRRRRYTVIFSVRYRYRRIAPIRRRPVDESAKGRCVDAVVHGGLPVLGDPDLVRRLRQVLTAVALAEFGHQKRVGGPRDALVVRQRALGDRTLPGQEELPTFDERFPVEVADAQNRLQRSRTALPRPALVLEDVFDLRFDAVVRLVDGSRPEVPDRRVRRRRRKYEPRIGVLRFRVEIVRRIVRPSGQIVQRSRSAGVHQISHRDKRSIRISPEVNGRQNGDDEEDADRVRELRQAVLGHSNSTNAHRRFASSVRLSIVYNL